MADVPNVRLSDGVEIPQLGFGVFQVPPEDTQRAVEEALAVGYRHIDTAAAYRNERGVAAAIAASGIPREEIFVTTKLWNSEQGLDSTLAAFEQSLEELDTDHVDLYLIHWPVPSQDLYMDTWRAFERIKARGRLALDRRLQLPHRGSRAAGTRGRADADGQPDRAPPAAQQAELRAWHAEHEIATEAWSPLAQGEVLKDETLTAIAAATSAPSPR